MALLMVMVAGLVGIDMQLLFKNSKQTSIIEMAVGCKEVTINHLGDLVIDGAKRGVLDTTTYNFIECDGKDFFYMIIKDTDDCRNL